MQKKIEIERKFLIKEDKLLYILLNLPHRSYNIYQYYLNKNFRLRFEEHSNEQIESYINIKTNKGNLIERQEWQQAIPKKQAEELWQTCSQNKIGLGNISKTRHIIKHDSSLNWEIDIFHLENKGLIIAEIEIPNKDFDLSSVIKKYNMKEITNYKKYYNSYLAQFPYNKWK